MVKTKSFFRSLLYVAVAVLIGATYLSMGRSIGGGDWNGKPTEADLRGAAKTFVLPSGFPPADVQILQKVTFLAVVFDAELESDLEQVAAFFLKQAAENKWQVKMDRQQTDYRLMVFCDGRLARSVELTVRGRIVKLYGGIYWESNRNSDMYCSTALQLAGGSIRMPMSRGTRSA
ncbi:hypothetical protein NJH49_10270 [Stenotrophomonas maltophilia]|uniref:hypothetical protein n=1 Tax=Stenotrophomonas maltophilia TaxID=40324 RepID=UPI0020978958|nr:hypothetical protein [Stenotrophomonas maltophilia]MCO7397514.1 hypothetical protein [Stenotrophomonas maltophilia]MCO7411771.1 hypothetical protein [Stenotrophomonas maltophilia]